MTSFDCNIDFNLDYDDLTWLHQEIQFKWKNENNQEKLKKQVQLKLKRHKNKVVTKKSWVERKSIKILKKRFT